MYKFPEHEIKGVCEQLKHPDEVTRIVVEHLCQGKTQTQLAEENRITQQSIQKRVKQVKLALGITGKITVFAGTSQEYTGSVRAIIKHFQLAPAHPQKSVSHYRPGSKEQVNVLEDLIKRLRKC